MWVTGSKHWEGEGGEGAWKGVKGLCTWQTHRLGPAPEQGFCSRL